jgi:hypothetical protein
MISATAARSTSSIGWKSGMSFRNAALAGMDAC